MKSQAPLPARKHPVASGGADTREAPATHDSIPLPGCIVHSPLSIDVLGWISGALRSDEECDAPSPQHFMNFDATLQVRTFDDIDRCVKIAVAALVLDATATMGLRELIVNAVEHGNLEIDFDQKSDLLANGEWQDEIEKRLAAKELGDRIATVRLSRDDVDFTIEITDQGAGFDWRKHLDPDTAPTHMLHGRGMSLAMVAGFKSIQYRGTGNQVIITGESAGDHAD